MPFYPFISWNWYKTESKDMKGIAIDMKDFFDSVMFDPYFNLQNKNPGL